MYYISSHFSPQEIRQWGRGSVYYDKIGITDTKDNVEEFFNNEQVLKMLRENKLTIYGTDVYGIDTNHLWVFTTVLKPFSKPSNSELTKHMRNLRDCLPNQTKAKLVLRDYLAMLPLKSYISYSYSYSGNYDDPRKYNGFGSIHKVQDDGWYLNDKSHIMDGKIVNTEMISQYMGVVSCSIEFVIRECDLRGNVHK